MLQVVAIVGRRTPLILQTETAECGLACLAMIAGHYGHRVDLPALRQKFNLSLRGTTLLDLVQIASDLRLATRAVRAELPHLQRLRLPCILHWDHNHFVVLIRVRGRRIVIHDPAVGRRYVPMQQVNKRFTGIVLEGWPTRKTERERVQTKRATDFVDELEKETATLQRRRWFQSRKRRQVLHTIEEVLLVGRLTALRKQRQVLHTIEEVLLVGRLTALEVSLRLLYWGLAWPLLWSVLAAVGIGAALLRAIEAGEHVCSRWMWEWQWRRVVRLLAKKHGVPPPPSELNSFFALLHVKFGDGKLCAVLAAVITVSWLGNGHYEAAAIGLLMSALLGLAWLRGFWGRCETKYIEWLKWLEETYGDDVPDYSPAPDIVEHESHAANR